MEKSLWRDAQNNKRKYSKVGELCPTKGSKKAMLPPLKKMFALQIPAWLVTEQSPKPPDSLMSCMEE